MTEGQDAIGRTGHGAEPEVSPLATLITNLARTRKGFRVGIGTAPSGCRTVSDILADATIMDAWLSAQAVFTTDLDRKAQAAYLIIDHSSLVAMGVAAPYLTLRILPEIRPDHVALTFTTGMTTHEGRSVEETEVALHFLSERFATDNQELQAHPCHTPRGGECLRNTLRSDLEGHFQPVVHLLASLSGLSRSALWRLVADQILAVFLEVGRQIGNEEEARLEALAIIKHPGSPLNNRQTSHFSISVRATDDPSRILSSRTYRARGGCCRFYTSRTGRYCSTCVHRDPIERNRDLENRLRSQLRQDGMQ